VIVERRPRILGFVASLIAPDPESASSERLKSDPHQHAVLALGGSRLRLGQAGRASPATDFAGLGILGKVGLARLGPGPAGA